VIATVVTVSVAQGSAEITIVKLMVAV
jgi:hypothetical protein